MVGTEMGMARWQSVIADGSISIERAVSGGVDRTEPDAIS
jgi:hypothetical protein